MTHPDPDIAEIERLEKEASPAPWVYNDCDGHMVEPGGGFRAIPQWTDKTFPLLMEVETSMFSEHAEIWHDKLDYCEADIDQRIALDEELRRNLRLAAALRNAAPALIAAYKERDVLRAENERLFAAHNKLAQRIAALTGEKSDG